MDRVFEWEGASVDRECPRCGRYFQDANPDHKYCTYRCRKEGERDELRARNEGVMYKVMWEMNEHMKLVYTRLGSVLDASG